SVFWISWRCPLQMNVPPAEKGHRSADECLQDEGTTNDAAPSGGEEIGEPCRKRGARHPRRRAPHGTSANNWPVLEVQRRAKLDDAREHDRGRTQVAWPRHQVPGPGRALVQRIVDVRTQLHR